ncbi:hypothetical protein Taro_018201 [Colocasia esculenta]|uniref:Uncharacterized protein n=1 Tax=Colocasia esculenta TaxID=4460 RepID=A0A843UI47_COLES|nr:hypothetical protein [Colocasia esculenta]
MNARQSSEHVEIKTSYAQDVSSVLSQKQNKIESWFREKPSQSIEPSDNSIVNTKYLESTLSTMSGPFSVLHQTENAISASSPFSNSISHTPAAVKALPCSSESTTEIRSSSTTSSQNFGNACDKWPCNHGPRSIVSKGGGTFFYPNGIHRSFLSESSASSHVHLPSVTFDNPNLRNGASSFYEKLEDRGPPKRLKRLPSTNVKTINDMNLDIASPRGFETENASEQKKLTDLPGKRESVPGGLSHLRTKSPCSEQLNANNVVCQGELGAVQGYSPLMLTYPTTCEFDEEKKREGIPSLDVLPLLSKAEGKIVQQNEASVPSSGKRILGFPLSPRTQYSPALDVRNGKEKLIHIDTSCRGKLLDVEKQIHTEMDLEKGVGKCSNISTGRSSFNCSTRSMDQPKSSEHSSKDEVKLPSLLTVQFTIPRLVSDIDLEAPITCRSEDRMLSAESAIDLNRLVSPTEQESKRDVPQAKEIGDETIVRLAAETIHTMWLDKHIHPEVIAGYATPPASNDSLNWFADVVISNSDDQEVSRGEGQASLDIDGMDYFEYMTLNLEEVRVDDYCSNPLKISDPKDEETGVAHLLLTKPRRGPARRRRQKRDFQRDILPGLASLARHEVTEDIQVIGVLMRAAGESWEAGGSRKNRGRSRSHAQPRGRGRRRGTPAAAAVVETPLDPHPSDPSNDTEARVRGRSIVGWGRTTRRCWRQRCSSGNILGPTPNLKSSNNFVLPG